MRAPAYVRRVLERLGAMVDPAENHMDNDVMDEALARMTAMATVTMAEVALIRESFGMWPVVWRTPAPRTADAFGAAPKVWIGFDGAYDDAAIVVVEKRPKVARYFLNRWVAGSEEGR